MTSLSWILMAVLGGGAFLLIAVALWVHPEPARRATPATGPAGRVPVDQPSPAVSKSSGPLKMPVCA